MPSATCEFTQVDTTDDSPELVKGVSKNKNLGVTDECLLLFGNGDGGGGPTPKMLEKVSFMPERIVDS